MSAAGAIIIIRPPSAPRGGGRTRASTRSTHVRLAIRRPTERMRACAHSFINIHFVIAILRRRVDGHSPPPPPHSRTRSHALDMSAVVARGLRGARGAVGRRRRPTTSTTRRATLASSSAVHLGPRDDIRGDDDASAARARALASDIGVKNASLIRSRGASDAHRSSTSTSGSFRVEVTNPATRSTLLSGKKYERSILARYN